MDTLSLRNMILSTPLRELPVSIDGWVDPSTGSPANLIIRELDGKDGAELIAACSDSEGKVNQEALVAGIILATLRNADEGNKPLVFSQDPVNKPDEYQPAFRDGLMATGLGRIMQVANQSIQLSGLDANAVKDAKNASSQVVEGSLSASQGN